MVRFMQISMGQSCDLEILKRGSLTPEHPFGSAGYQNARAPVKFRTLPGATSIPQLSYEACAVFPVASGGAL
jgi:hypothetical protein